MPSASFVQAKKTGRYFEGLMRPVLAEMGMEVIDSENFSYREKKGYDCLVKVNGSASRVEFKFDQMSEQTQNVAVDLDSIKKSTAPIWIYGLPEGHQIHAYSMLLSDLAPFALNWPVKRPGGEWASPIALIPKTTFLAQNWVKKFKTISLN